MGILQKLCLSYVVLTLICAIYTFGRTHTESLLILSSIGVMFKQCSYLSTKTTFYDISTIKDIVILEAISKGLTLTPEIKELSGLLTHEVKESKLKQSVIFQLVLLPKIQLPPDRSNKIHPLFMSFNPCLEDLKKVYRHIQEKLILPLKDS